MSNLKQNKNQKKKNQTEEKDNMEEVGDLAAWETLKTPWQEIEEDAFGAISWKNEKTEERKRKQRMESMTTELRIEKGMIRYIYVILDCSQSMNKRDLKPNRMVVAQQMIEKFIREFFDQNPLSQIGIIIAHHKIAQKITELGGTPLHQIQQLHNITDHLLEYERTQIEKSTQQQQQQSVEASLAADDTDLINAFSLQNALELAKSALSQIPVYGSKEIIIVTSALSTIDPNDIFDTVKALKTLRIRTNIISLSGELHILSLIAKRTFGAFNVAMNEAHFQDLLLSLVPPQPVHAADGELRRKWVKMGFPLQKINNFPSMCFCHEQFTYKGHYCPRCNSKQCELPTDCNVCGLQLISSPHLVRSYHHILPVPQFTEATVDESQEWLQCFGCQTMLNTRKHLMERCPKCNHCFCIECNVFIHESLHNCPGCMSLVGSM